MFSSLQSMIVTIKPRIAVTARWIYQKTFSAKDRIAFYDMLAFLLDNNKSLQQAFIDMRNVVTDFGRKHHPYAVLLTDCLSAQDKGLYGDNIRQQHGQTEVSFQRERQSALPATILAVVYLPHLQPG